MKLEAVHDIAVKNGLLESSSISGGWCQIPGLVAKLDDSWEGPYKIVKCVSAVKYMTYDYGHVQSKNGVDLVEVSIFYKSEKKGSQTVWPIKIKTVALFSLIMAA